MRDDFKARIIKIVAGIKRGNTLTYKEVARRAGNPKATRAVGNILNRYFRECMKSGGRKIPCHRVIRSDGRLGGYARGEREKKRLLKKKKSARRAFLESKFKKFISLFPQTFRTDLDIDLPFQKELCGQGRFFCPSFF